ncbi:MAG: hypothetical protein ACRCYY_04685 [Trueperaceae bacterium]
MKKLYPKIRQLRETTGVSGHDAAYQAGLSFPTYYGLETKPSDPTADTFLAVVGMLSAITQKKPKAVFDLLLEDRPQLSHIEPVIKQGVLEALRVETGLSVHALAKEAGIGATTLYVTERLPVNSTGNTLLAVLAVLSKHLKRSPHRLFEEAL